MATTAVLHEQHKGRKIVGTARGLDRLGRCESHRRIELMGGLISCGQIMLRAGESGLIGRERQRRLLGESAGSLSRSLEVTGGGEELVAEELRRAALSLGRLLGRVDVVTPRNQWKVRPPSTASAAPVTKDDSVLVRNKMACAISSGSAMRFSA